jgi:hypothetical protein
MLFGSLKQSLSDEKWRVRMDNQNKVDALEAAALSKQINGNDTIREGDDVKLISPDPTKEAGKPGELYFLVLLTLLTLALLIDSFKLEGIINGKLSGPSSVPQIVLFAMLAFLAGIGVSLLKAQFKKSDIRDINYLISKEVVILLIMVLVYAFLLPYLHFAAASLIFLWVTTYLLERKRLWHKLLISVCFLACLILIFKYAMKVVLP